MLDIFKKTQKQSDGSEEIDLIKITALLIHAARIDNNYSDKEKIIDFENC